MRRPGYLDLNEVVQHPGRTVQVPVSTTLDSEGDLDLTRPVTGEFSAVSTGNVLVVRLHCNTAAVVECSHCGEPTEFEIDFKMQEEFTVEGIPSAYSADSYAEVECDEPDLFKGNAINLEEMVRQGVWLNLPTQALCTSGCAVPETGGGRAEAGHPGLQSLRSILKEERA